MLKSKEIVLMTNHFTVNKSSRFSPIKLICLLLFCFVHRPKCCVHRPGAILAIMSRAAAEFLAEDFAEMGKVFKSALEGDLRDIEVRLAQ